MIRQSLIGGDYALINRNTLKPNPDYWVSWLWGKLMGEDVFAVQSNDPFVQTYCHSAKKERQNAHCLSSTCRPSQKL